MPAFDSTVVSAVLAHMNGDHPDDNLLIAQAFGDRAADSATMVGLDGTAGFWSYSVGEDRHDLRMPWSTTISERAEIRREVVVLYDAACARLGLTPRAHD
ncbi:MAG: DUF2470 domain-containing protein [Micrococcales bacterium]|nr:DUF2470 domain-containing protein [Micrococcales bacterium]